MAELRASREPGAAELHPFQFQPNLPTENHFTDESGLFGTVKRLLQHMACCAGQRCRRNASADVGSRKVWKLAAVRHLQCA